MRMNRYVFVALIVAALSIPGSAEQGWDKPEPSRSAVPQDVPFELVDNPRRAETFRIDKSSGRVWRLQRVSGIGAEAWAWKPIPPPDDTRLNSLVNYQLLVSPSDMTFLLNVHTGQAWLLRRTSGELSWLAVTVDR